MARNFPSRIAAESSTVPRMHRWIPALLLVALLAAFRVLGSAFPEKLPNVQPLLALFLCSLIFLKGTARWLIPTIIWLLTDPFSSLLQNHSIFGWHHLALACGIAATAGIAWYARRRPTAFVVMGSAAISAGIFYYLTNLVSFATDPLYPKTVTGFIQAQWTGPIGYGPTWVFLRNLLAANLAFTGLFLLARQSLPAADANPSQIPAR